MEDWMDKTERILTGKVAVITGASQGLGESLARLYASEGATVILAARNLSAVEKIAAELTSAGFLATGYMCDVQDLKQVEALARYAIQSYKGIDIWVNNAGISGPYGRSFDLPVDKFMAVLQTNVVGVYNGSLTALRHFVPNKQGKLINILGRGDDGPVPMQNAYASSKIWIKSFTLALAKEYKDSGVGVFAYNPGLMDTDFLRIVETIEGMQDKLKVMPFLIKTFASPPIKGAKKALWLASHATDGKTGLYVRNMSRLGMLVGLVKKLFSPSKEPIELKIIAIPSAFESLE
jgi:glucose 1-dehydrogenase